MRCQRPRARRVIDQQYAFGLLPITSSARTRRAVGLFRRRLFWPLEIYDQLVLRRLLNGRSPGLAPCEISPLPVAWDSDHLLDAFGDLGHREVLVAVVDSLEPAPVERRDSSREQVEIAAQDDELGTGSADRRSVVATKVGDRLEIRRQPAGQPHQLDVALALPLEPAAR